MERRELSREITDYYELGMEGDRLEAGPGKLEFVRTQELVRRHLPDPPARVLDVGGATGAHAFPLAALGYHVELIDPVPSQVEAAKKLSSGSSHPLARIEVGDARAIPAEEGVADAVLLLGPLYHLIEREDRVQALAEARRVLRPGGLVFTATISRYASTCDGLVRSLLKDPVFRGIVDQDLTTGVHRNPTDNPMYFTTAYFHLPEEIEAEIRDAGLRFRSTLAVEGPAWMLQNFDEVWGDPDRRQELLEAVRRVEEAPSLLGASAHWLSVGERA